MKTNVFETPQQSHLSNTKKKPNLSPPSTPGRIHGMLENGDVPEFFPVSRSVLGLGYTPTNHRSKGFTMLNDLVVPTISLRQRKYDPKEKCLQHHIASRKSTINIRSQDMLKIPSLLSISDKDQTTDQMTCNDSIALSEKSPSASVADIHEPEIAIIECNTRDHLKRNPLTALPSTVPKST